LFLNLQKFASFVGFVPGNPRIMGVLFFVPVEKKQGSYYNRRMTKRKNISFGILTLKHIIRENYRCIEEMAS